jgi:hypothetical protein
MEINSFRGEYFFLSNFYAHPFQYNGLMWKTSEHAFQAMKASSKVEMLAIKMASSPGKAKKMGRECTVVADWEEIKISVMEDVLKAKFSIPELCEKLLATGDASLVELNNWGDRFWGRCLDRSGRAVGQNWLGRLLMKLREELRSNDRNKET